VALGFFVLLATFGVVSGYTIVKMRQLEKDLQFVRTAYFETSLAIAQLNTQQSNLLDALEGKLPRPYIAYGRQQIDRLIDSTMAQLEPFAGVSQVGRMRSQFEQLRDQIRANDPLFDAAVAPQGTAESRAAAFEKLKLEQHRLNQGLHSLFNNIKSDAIRITMNLEEVERQASLAAIGLGAIGAILGVLVTVWSVLTLRPLRRLHEAVRKVAGGNYRERVDTAGGTEVADLAREFNAMAAALSDREQELVRSERLAAVGKMAAIITHEVRNPLSSIGLNAELLEEEVAPISQEAVALSRAIGKEVDRLTAITEEYLRFARMPRPRLEREDVNGIVAGVVEFQREDLAKRGVAVATDLAATLPSVAADEAQLRQALLNLFRNAADAMPTGGKLTVSTRAEDGAVEVAVRDDGPGIPAEHLPRIFEPFFSTKEGGTGLGLALTQHIIAEHGGRIAVESAPGRGTTFRLALPASP
jgi:two-component system, NtrC family, sensor kinase